MSTEPTWPEVVLAALNVVQLVALAHISTRSKRVRKGDREGPEHLAPPD